VSYDVSITGYIYDSDIEHDECSHVIEKVSVKNGRVKILVTTSGRFWKK